MIGVHDIMLDKDVFYAQSNSTVKNLFLNTRWTLQ